jgi:hypothetical protein
VLASLLAMALGVGAPGDPGRAASIEPVALSLVSPSDAGQCPNREALTAAVIQRLGSDPFQPEAKRSLQVVLRKDGETWLADLELREGAKVLGHQTLHSATADCADLGPILALTISVVCGASPTSVAQPDAPPETQIEKRFSVIPEVAPQPQAGIAAAEPPKVWVGLGALGTVGAAPSFAPGGTLELEATWRRFSFGIEGRADLPATKTLQTGHLDAGLLYAALLPCGRFGHWSGCALIAFGSERASGSGYDGAKTDSTLYAGLGLQARLDLPLSPRWAIRLHADGIAPTTRAVVQVKQEIVWRVPAVSFGLGAELLAALP